jgi:hypothetical protein
MQFYTAQLYLCQVTVIDHNPSSQNLHYEASFQIDALRMGLSAAKMLMDFYISLPLGCDAKFNNVGWVQLGFAVTLACKLVVAASEPAIHPHTADLCGALDLSNVLKRCVLRIQALITSNVDASGDRDVFCHYEKRLKRVQWWFENRMLSASSNDYSHDRADLARGNLASTEDATHGVKVFQSTMDDLDSFIQWPGFFPDAAIDDMYIDWMA